MIVLSREHAAILFQYVAGQLAPVQMAMNSLQNQLNTPEGAAPPLAQVPENAAND